MENKTHLETLSDGRKLAYAEYGDVKGKPCLYFHGHPGSRLQGAFFSEIALKYNIRLIAIDRPGVGRSDFKAKRSLLDWPQDVVELVNALKIDKFAVMGISGGGPYALSCAFLIPERLTACYFLAGLAPVEYGTEGMSRSGRSLLKISQKMPWLLRPFMWLSFRNVQDYKFMVKAYERQKTEIPAADRKVVENPKIRDMLIADAQEAFRPGLEGVVWDSRIYAKSWGFELKDISPDLKVHIWHGEKDQNVPVHMARKACEAIPNCTAKILPNDGHLSVYFNNLDELFDLIRSSF